MTTTASTTICDDEAGTMTLAPWHGPEGGYALWHKGHVVWRSAGMWMAAADEPIPDDGRPILVSGGKWCGELTGPMPMEGAAFVTAKLTRTDWGEPGYAECGGEGYATWIIGPTHWMPLPAPPTSEQTDD